MYIFHDAVNIIDHVFFLQIVLAMEARAGNVEGKWHEVDVEDNQSGDGNTAVDGNTEGDGHTEGTEANTEGYWNTEGTSLPWEQETFDEGSEYYSDESGLGAFINGALRRVRRRIDRLSNTEGSNSEGAYSVFLRLANTEGAHAVDSSQGWGELAQGTERACDEEEFRKKRGEGCGKESAAFHDKDEQGTRQFEQGTRGNGNTAGEQNTEGDGNTEGSTEANTEGDGNTEGTSLPWEQETPRWQNVSGRAAHWREPLTPLEEQLMFGGHANYVRWWHCGIHTIHEDDDSDEDLVKNDQDLGKSDDSDQKPDEEPLNDWWSSS